MADKDVSNLQRDFPDLTQSMLSDVLKTYGNDARKAKQALTGFDEDVKREQDKKVRDLHSSFPLLPEELVRATLEGNNWDSEASVVPLIYKSEEYQQKKVPQRLTRVTMELTRILGLREQEEKGRFGERTQEVSRPTAGSAPEGDVFQHSQGQSPEPA